MVGNKTMLYAGTPQEAKPVRVSTNGQSAGNLRKQRVLIDYTHGSCTIITKYDILMVMDRELKNRYQREYRQRTKNACTNKYERTINGFLMRKYRNMESRVMGIQKLKSHLYQGKDLLDRESFYRWAKSSPEFHKLWNVWVISGYDRKLCPTVDRKDPKTGYHLSNMEWITHSENSRRGNVSRYSKMKI